MRISITSFGKLPKQGEPKLARRLNLCMILHGVIALCRYSRQRAVTFSLADI